MSFNASPKQKEFFLAKDARINVLTGSVSSGKTYCSLVKWAMRVMCAPLDCTFLMAGKTQTTLKRNCLQLLQQLFGERNFHYSMSTKQGILFNHLVYLEGADNESAEDKIRGITLDGAYLDEVTLMPESFFIMLLSRLRRAGAFCYGTTNPDTPTHWLKENYMNRAGELDCKIWEFRLEDNVFLPPKYIENIKKEYTGVHYKRFILGEWVIADGLVYSAFNEDTMLIPSPTLAQINSDYAEKYVSIDYGIENPTAFGLYAWHIERKEWHKVKDFSYGGRENQRPKTDPELYQDLVDFTAGINGIDGILIDPSASSFKVLIQKNSWFKVRDANNDVLSGIAFTNTCFAQNKLKICDCCKATKKELYAYSWDTEKSRQTGRDTVIKQNDHNMDEMRYFCYTVVRPKTRLYGIVMPNADKL